MLDHGDLLRTAVTEVVAVDDADDALVAAHVVEELPNPGTINHQSAVFDPAGCVDGVEEQRGRVVGVTPERSFRRRTVVGLIRREELISRHSRALVRVRTEPHVRTREEHSLTGLDLQETINQKTISSQQCRALETRNTRRLIRNEVTSRLEDREEQRLRRTRSHLSQHRNHVGVFLRHSREPCDLTTQRHERIRERRSKTLGIGITVMNRSSRGQTKLVEHELRHRRALEQIVVSGAVVADVVVRPSIALLIARQRRRSVRRRDHHHAGLADQRSSSSRRTRTAGTNHTNDLLVSNDRLCSSLTTISRTQIIKTRTHVDSKALDIAIVRDRLLNTTLIRQTKERHITRNRVQRPNLNGRPSLDSNDTQRAIAHMIHVIGRCSRRSRAFIAAPRLSRVAVAASGRNHAEAENQRE